MRIVLALTIKSYTDNSPSPFVLATTTIYLVIKLPISRKPNIFISMLLNKTFDCRIGQLTNIKNGFFPYN